MPVTWPRALPGYLKALSCDMRLEEVTTTGMTRGGGVISTELAPAWWRLEIETQPLTRAQKADLQAWWNTLRGGLKTFLAYDHFSQWPSAYASEAAVLALPRAASLGAFNGTFEITAFTSVYEMRTVNPAALRLPANFTLTAGDYIGLVQSGRYSLHRIVETVTSNASGNMAGGAGPALFVEPAVNTTLFTAGAVANIIRPLAEFVPDRERFQAVQTVTPSSAVIAGISKVVT